MTIEIFKIAGVYFLILYAIIFHEISHGLMALKLGDPTPRDQKRLTLNPLAHLSFLGSILFPIASIFILGFAFGWAKPVRIKAENLKNPARDMAKIGAAGPLANFICAGVAGIIIRLILIFHSSAPVGFWQYIALGSSFFLYINIFLGLFNLIPIPPFDGGHIFLSLFPQKTREEIMMATPFIIWPLLMIFFVMGGMKTLILASTQLHYLLSGALPLFF